MKKCSLSIKNIYYKIPILCRNLQSDHLFFKFILLKYRQAVFAPLTKKRRDKISLKPPLTFSNLFRTQVFDCPLCLVNMITYASGFHIHIIPRIPIVIIAAEIPINATVAIFFFLHIHILFVLFVLFILTYNRGCLPYIR